MPTSWMALTVGTAFLLIFLYFLYRQSVDGTRLLAIGPVLFWGGWVCQQARAFVSRAWLRHSLIVIGYVLFACSLAASLRFEVTR